MMLELEHAWNVMGFMWFCFPPLTTTTFTVREFTSVIKF